MSQSLSDTTLSIETPPAGNWIWSQHWLDVLFLHWSVPVASVQAALPPGIEVETWDGSAWVSVVLFQMKVRPRWLPYMPFLSHLTEINYRTYVRCGGRSGIYFLTMYADNPLIVCAARLFSPLPYQKARMRYRRLGEEFHFDGEDPSRPDIKLDLKFRPVGDGVLPRAGSMEEWLAERYRAFVFDGQGHWLEGEVRHPSWALRTVELSSSLGDGATWWAAAPPRAPDLMHFSEGVQARFWPFRRVINE